MLNERQLKIVDLLKQQPRTPGELAQQTGVSGRTILRDIDYLNFTLNGKARISASGNAGYQLEIFERRSFFQLLQKHDNDDRLLALLLLNTFTPRAQLASALNLPETWVAERLPRLKQRYERGFVSLVALVWAISLMRQKRNALFCWRIFYAKIRF